MRRFVQKPLAGLLILAFLVSDVRAYAQGVTELPAPGIRLALGPAFAPPLLKGIKVYRDDPFRFDFILDKGDAMATGEQVGPDASRLIKYFLASLTVPEKDLWVNLSPYEKDRIVPEAFGRTGMGRDLLAQDYILKQMTASLIYPEEGVGKEFWGKVYAEALRRYGTTEVPVDTFNKVWIVPGKAKVYENKDAAFVVESRLKVMLESDYVAMSRQRGVAASTAPVRDEIAKLILREVVIPVLEKEVNEGKNFATLRQVYNSLILATWYKRKVKAGVMGQAYVDRQKTGGIEIADKDEKERIWVQYVEAFHKGVYSLIKEELDPATQTVMPRKYFSGGITALDLNHDLAMTHDFAAVPALSPECLDVIRMRAVPAAKKDGHRYQYKAGSIWELNFKDRPVIVSWGYLNDYSNIRSDYLVRAYDKGKLVGVYFAEIVNALDRTVSGAGMSVDPSYQKQGIGEHLFREMLSLLKDKGFNRYIVQSGTNFQKPVTASSQALARRIQRIYSKVIVKTIHDHEYPEVISEQTLDLQRLDLLRIGLDEKKGASGDRNTSMPSFVKNAQDITPGEQDKAQDTIKEIYLNGHPITSQALADEIKKMMHGRVIFHATLDNDVFRLGVVPSTIGDKTTPHSDIKSPPEGAFTITGFITSPEPYLEIMMLYKYAYQEKNHIPHFDQLVRVARLFVHNGFSKDVVLDYATGTMIKAMSGRMLKGKNIPETMGELAALYLSTEPDDNAMAPGGIDLDPARMDMATQDSGEEPGFKIDPAMLRQIQDAAGVTPVIVGIDPLDSLPRFMGVQAPVVK